MTAVAAPPPGPRRERGRHAVGGAGGFPADGPERSRGPRASDLIGSLSVPARVSGAMEISLGRLYIVTRTWKLPVQLDPTRERSK